jgi:hypothetical protein
METTTIKAKKDLYNSGKCFTKGQTYEVKRWDKVRTEAGLMECQTTNDQGEPHLIGAWWREFKIID